ncbi:hypothetical protein TspCOW1_12650 [Thiohalobacter sp. COW1]|uniref:hypothetical protein n=1 Tax=Thiohalobacter sp. COW1 TaxID=2795687 RepID=UPI00191587D2|nr:hypothetical protein [Thiohalobacter sp. COW1]BCO31162.1 hypothetical protein TspCOW1_12650 [Thiohalobacter sp. COW1]
MTKRKLDNYEESFKDFSVLFRRRINEDIELWRSCNPEHAKGREMAYSACLFELKEALEKNGLTLADVGLAGYEVPKSDQLE